MALVDLCVAAFFIGLALTSSRWWPLWAAAFHVMALIMVVVTALDPSIRPYTYYVGEQIWDYIGLTPLLFGALIERRRNVEPLARLHASSSASAR